MTNVCILTDSTAQFAQPSFPGRERVFIIPFELQNGGISFPGKSSLKPRLVPPSPAEFVHFYTQLSLKYDSIIVLTISSHLSPAMNNALSATLQFSNNTTVEVVDSLTAAVGLGMLVQIAAGAAAEAVPVTEIARRIRVALPRIYSLYCLPDLMVLARAGYMDQPQAVAGEMMGLLPIFALEEGRLVPMEKVRTPRHLFEAFQDFMSEFEKPNQITLIQGQHHSTIRAKPFRQYMQETFPQTPFSQVSLQPHMAALFGPQATGLVILEVVE